MATTTTTALPQFENKAFVSREDKNRRDLNVLLEKGQEYLLGVFHTNFPRNQTDLYNELLKHRPKLQNLYPNIIKEDQWDLLYPSSKQPDSSKFNITLTFLLIRQLCGYKAPSTGWDNEPDVTDCSVIANCIRVKFFGDRLNDAVALQVSEQC